MLDLTQARDAHVDARLRSEPIIWLSTVRPDGRPHLVPVWFLWDGATILIFSQLRVQKIRNIRGNPRVMLALNAVDDGEDVVTIEGEARLLPEGTVDATLPVYAAKYEQLMARIKTDAATMAADYSQAIRITPIRFVHM